MFSKVLIANRGEIACRVIRACHALGLRSVAVYSEADAGSLHTSQADEAVAIGPAAPRDSYLCIAKLLEAAAATGAGAIHPGYGFLSESDDFARAVREAGLTWIGPEAETIAAMGDKSRARQIAQAAGVPVVTGSTILAAADADALLEAGRRVGYPLLVKAAAGGGGIGMVQVGSAETLPAAALRTSELAQRYFGDGGIYLERYIPQARHVEVQVMGDGSGRAIHLYERDCSLQRRFQKVIEESPAPGLLPATRRAMLQAAVELAAAQRYRGPGTVEYIVDAASQAFYFLEMNTRIQVEHPVTEMVTGLDLVAMQLRIARGETLPVQQSEVAVNGHAIECRLYAEDPAARFRPSTGRLSEWVMPTATPSVRLDTGYRLGDLVTPYYDPLLAKLIVHAGDRASARALMLQTLAAVRISGVKTNLECLTRTIARPEFCSAQVHTRFIEDNPGLWTTAPAVLPASGITSAGL